MSDRLMSDRLKHRALRRLSQFQFRGASVLVAGIFAFLAAATGMAAADAMALQKAGIANAKGTIASPAKWPADVKTKHTVTVAGRQITFTATAGYITLKNAATREALADIAYIAFTRDGVDQRKRPVTFIFNGGPGYASAWLNLGAAGPWRIAMQGDGLFPSAKPELHDNQESWLPFTDLVFVDPAGTGYGRMRAKGAGDTLWSVKGDIDSLATTIRRWVEKNDRSASPKYLAGESYGGFRVPKIAHELQTDQGVGINGLILISPVLDFARRRFGGILRDVSNLPTMAASARIAKALPQTRVTRDDMREVEAYARGEYLLDLAKGRADRAAVARVVDRVAMLTGLDKKLVALLGGRISPDVFAREFYRGKGRIASMYDGTVTGLDPDRFSTSNDSEDQLRLGLHAPMTQAMVDLYRNRLKWVFPEGRYMFQNKQAGRNWKWGKRPPEAVSELASAIALDPKLRVLVVHGLTDLVTPYFETRMVLDQMPPIGDRTRITFQVYPGGHMFYSLDASRKAFRDDARAIIIAQDTSISEPKD